MTFALPRIPGGKSSGGLCGDIISIGKSLPMIASLILVADMARSLTKSLRAGELLSNSWSEFTKYLEPGVEAIVGSAVEVGSLVNGHVDFALASNLFEHLTQSELMRLLEGLRGLLYPKGTLNVIQPNFAHAFREYFDDYTHVSIYTHVGLSDLISANGFEVIEVRPRFLPSSMKARLPVSETLIRAYLASPIKPLAKQMLIRARVR